MAISRVLNDSQDITPYENKSFDELIHELRGTLLKASHIIPLLFEKGRHAGFDDNEIRAKIRDELNVPYRTMLRYIPQDAKQQQDHVRSRNVTKSTKDANWQPRLVIEDEEPQIPAPPQIIIEHEPEPKVKQLTEVKFPYMLWRDVRISQRMANLKSEYPPSKMNEAYITLKVDSEGILSL